MPVLDRTWLKVDNWIFFMDKVITTTMLVFAIDIGYFTTFILQVLEFIKSDMTSKSYEKKFTNSCYYVLRNDYF